VVLREIVFRLSYEASFVTGLEAQLIKFHPAYEVLIWIYKSRKQYTWRALGGHYVQARRNREQVVWHDLICFLLKKNSETSMFWLQSRFNCSSTVFCAALSLPQRQGRNEWGARGAQLPGAESLRGAPKSPNNVTSSFINAVHLLPKDLRFQHAGAKLAS